MQEESVWNYNKISEYENMLLTAVGRVQNTGYDNEALENGHRRMASIDEDGFITGQLPCSHERNELVFEIGKEFSQMYYLIQTV